jgi:hypothetical protein
MPCRHPERKERDDVYYDYHAGEGRG